MLNDRCFMKRVFFAIILLTFMTRDFSAQMYVYPDDVYYERGDENIIKVIVEDPEVREMDDTGIIYAAEEDSILYFDELTDSIASQKISKKRDVSVVSTPTSFLQENVVCFNEKKLFIKPKSYHV